MRIFNYFVKKLLLFCFGIIILTSCEKNEIITNSSDEKKLNFISKTDAVKFANNLLYNDLQGNNIKKEVVLLGHGTIIQMVMRGYATDMFIGVIAQFQC
ncbi:hypothetical protein [Flavobacterium branchiophilum]|uniref:hypothetical protein n=1 Tax=Flavobacterium branchiophilum TaxID=55197 RepID=UPI000B5BF5E9|nr:hypothetical protein [Flavobacterium branchiophilum]GEM54418.1 hypothetical protein FB1_06390 [Flavobacterium branchiophilum NBRC 15030 = ATCC 35035]